MNLAPLKTGERICIVCAKGLGDALISMVLAQNLTLSGYRVTTFSSVLCQLKEWFPGQVILPYPTAKDFHKTFSPFTTVIAADHSLINASHTFGNRLIILKEASLNKRLSMVENLQRVCKQTLALPFSDKANGISPLPHLTFKKHPNRILLHPMSSDAKKNWPALKFSVLAKKLEKVGYAPYFCVSPSEREEWEGRIPLDQLPLFPSVSDLAAFVYESGFLIGNDSGVGHLASALNIPTLSIFARKSYSHLWRPGWSWGDVVTPPSLLPGSRLKQKYWKRLLSVNQVYRAFTNFSNKTTR